MSATPPAPGINLPTILPASFSICGNKLTPITEETFVNAGVSFSINSGVNRFPNAFDALSIPVDAKPTNTLVAASIPGMNVVAICLVKLPKLDVRFSLIEEPIFPMFWITPPKDFFNDRFASMAFLSALGKSTPIVCDALVDVLLRLVNPVDTCVNADFVFVPKVDVTVWNEDCNFLTVPSKLTDCFA